MKVYVKKEDKVPSNYWLGFLIFIVVPIVLFIMIFSNNKSFEEILSKNAVALLFALVFLAIGIYTTFIQFKKPKGYRARLIEKRIENYNGTPITYMTFSVDIKSNSGEYFPIKYKCYTKENNNLVIGGQYLLIIKESNRRPMSVESLANCNPEDYVVKEKRSPLYYIFLAIFGGMALLCIIGAILYPKYTMTYVIMEVIFLIILFYLISGSLSNKK